MSGAPLYTVEDRALLKILLHAIKYPSSAVNGLLLGEVKGEGSSRSTAIQDALPLFHSFLSLAPALETALCQAQAYAQQAGRAGFVGYYHANERLSDLELGPVARRIADKVHGSAAHTCVLLVDNSKLAEFLRQGPVAPLQLWTREGAGAWTRAPARRLELRAADPPRLLQDALARRRHCRLHDFDDHLGDLRKDWLNRELAV